MLARLDEAPILRTCSLGSKFMVANSLASGENEIIHPSIAADACKLEASTSNESRKLVHIPSHLPSGENCGGIPPQPLISLVICRSPVGRAGFQIGRASCRERV